MMHQERWNLAEDISARMGTTYPDIIVGGVYGSTARSTDTKWSDLELLFIVQDGSSLTNQHFMYRGTAVGYEALKKSELEKHLTTPTVKWPFWMGVLSVLKVLYGNPEQVTAWLDHGKAVPVEKFKKIIETNLPNYILESYGRILSCRERKNTYDITCAVLEVVFEMNVVLCLLNKSWVTHDYYHGIEESFSFPRLPENYKDMVSALWSARTIEEIVPLAEKLVKAFYNLLEQEGIAITEYQTVHELPL